jgi:hypothetical protein
MRLPPTLASWNLPHQVVSADLRAQVGPAAQEVLAARAEAAMDRAAAATPAQAASRDLPAIQVRQAQTDNLAGERLKETPRIAGAFGCARAISFLLWAALPES